MVLVVLAHTMGDSFVYCCLRTSVHRVGIEPQFSLIALLSVMIVELNMKST